jgi:hypothetical protein
LILEAKRFVQDPSPDNILLDRREFCLVSVSDWIAFSSELIDRSNFIGTSNTIFLLRKIPFRPVLPVMSSVTLMQLRVLLSACKQVF